MVHGLQRSPRFGSVHFQLATRFASRFEPNGERLARDTSDGDWLVCTKRFGKGHCRVCGTYRRISGRHEAQGGQLWLALSICRHECVLGGFRIPGRVGVREIGSQSAQIIVSLQTRSLKSTLVMNDLHIIAPSPSILLLLLLLRRRRLFRRNFLHPFSFLYALFRPL